MKKSTIKKSLTITEGVIPFTEKPSNDQFIEKEENGKNAIRASDLFSFFTADIIKEETLFTR
jgi:hypothetical protein